MKTSFIIYDYKPIRNIIQQFIVEINYKDKQFGDELLNYYDTGVFSKLEQQTFIQEFNINKQHITYAIRNNCKAFIQSVIENSDEQKIKQLITSKHYTIIAQKGYLELLKCLSVYMQFVFEIGRHHPFYSFVSIFNKAARNGHLDILIWIHDPLKGYGRLGAMILAAENGQLHVVKWLHKNKQHDSTRYGKAINHAARNGHLHVVKWLHENTHERCTESAMEWAAKNGHMQVVEYLHHISAPCTKNAMDWAAKNGYLHIVIFLHENSREGCTHLAMDYAASNGHLHVVMWLHKNRREGCANAMWWAHINGHVHVYEWLKKNLEA